MVNLIQRVFSYKLVSEFCDEIKSQMYYEIYQMNFFYKNDVHFLKINKSNNKFYVINNFNSIIVLILKYINVLVNFIIEII